MEYSEGRPSSPHPFVAPEHKKRGCQGTPSGFGSLRDYASDDGLRVSLRNPCRARASFTVMVRLDVPVAYLSELERVEIFTVLEPAFLAMVLRLTSKLKRCVDFDLL